MRRYDSYKDSGVEWIGEIPSGWRKSKFKYVSELQTGNSLNDEQKILYESENPDDIPYVSSKDIDVEFKTVHYDNGLRIPRENNRFRVSPKGSFLMVIEGGSSGRKMVFLDRDVCYVNKLCSFYSNENTKFQYYFVQSFNYQDKFKLSLSGLIGGVSISNLREFELPLPPLSEQQQIVTFLDTKTSLIDSLIEKTQRKIELLKEERTSLINELVTKGLNPNVEMKDSGVEWIGEIPSHWEVIKLKYFCELINEKGIPNNDEIKISPENVESNTGVCFNLYSEYSGEGVKFIEHDILLNKLRLYLKKVLFSEFEGFSMGEMIVLRIRIGIPKYYFRTLFHQGLIDVLDNQSTGVKLPRVSPELIMNTNFPVPPLIEQQQIVSYLDEHTQLIDKTISVEERRIELLKEYRQSLISEVVTGKRKIVD